MIAATFNAMGYSDAGLPGRLRAIAQAYVLCLTETWAHESTTWSTDNSVLQVLAPTTAGRVRRGGGVALMTCTHRRMQFLAERSSPHAQVVVARIDGVTIIGNYLAPARAQSVVQTTLHWVGTWLCGEVLMMGDLNAQHRQWDRATNPYGSALAKWALAHRLSISAPLTPTCQRSSGSSTVDLFISRAGRVNNPAVVPGSWEAT